MLRISRFLRVNGFAALAASIVFLAADQQISAQVVPGTGYRDQRVGDDFEDPEWAYIANLPKSSSNIDKRSRSPIGTARNGRLFESSFRGAPDVVQRVKTPDGGIEGSEGALMLQTLKTGIPGYLSREMQQDDFMVNVNRRIGSISTGRNPSVVIRLCLPEWDQWENRTGSHFGFRLDLTGPMWKEEEKKKGLFRRRIVKERVKKNEAYWPGFFIQFNSKDDARFDKDHAMLLMRCDHTGRDIPGPLITEPGWWTLGMSVTGEGNVHYFARQGVEDLRSQDHIVSLRPYGAEGQLLHSFFFNIVNIDDGKTWSTPFVIDDPAVFYHRR